jgi:hypothetical protein
VHLLACGSAATVHAARCSCATQESEWNAAAVSLRAGLDCLCLIKGVAVLQAGRGLQIVVVLYLEVSQGGLQAIVVPSSRKSMYAVDNSIGSLHLSEVHALGC